MIKELLNRVFHRHRWVKSEVMAYLSSDDNRPLNEISLNEYSKIGTQKTCEPCKKVLLIPVYRNQVAIKCFFKLTQTLQNEGYSVTYKHSRGK